MAVVAHQLRDAVTRRYNWRMSRNGSRSAGSGWVSALVGLAIFGWVIENIVAIAWLFVVAVLIVAAGWCFYRVGLMAREREAEHAAIAYRADLQERLLADGNPAGWAGFTDRSGIDWRTKDSVL